MFFKCQTIEMENRLVVARRQGCKYKGNTMREHLCGDGAALHLDCAGCLHKSTRGIKLYRTVHMCKHTNGCM